MPSLAKRSVQVGLHRADIIYAGMPALRRDPAQPGANGCGDHAIPAGLSVRENGRNLIRERDAWAGPKTVYSNMFDILRSATRIIRSVRHPIMHPAPADHDKVVSKIAASDTISVIACREFSFNNNITAERNGANPERSTEPANAVMRSTGRGGVVTLSPCVVFGGLRRAHRSPSPPNDQIADAPGS